MRLKTMDGPLSVHNGNNDILNSPKRINTVQNSNYDNSTTTSNYNTTTSTTTTTLNYNNSINFNDTNGHVINDLVDDLNILNRVVQDTVQWCNPSQEAQKRDLLFNNKNRHNLLNINNTLAATIRHVQRHGTASSIYSESSPDDSLLDYEEAQPSCSSTEPSPQDEERAFDVSDSESSEDGNLSNGGTLQRRGIVNPNYPGFQHLAHTLDFKTASDTDYTDDDLENESLTAKLQAEANNNNNFEEIDYKIDSVNRLDSVENIQKVFYDKTVFNVDDEGEFNQISESSSGNSNDEDTVSLNIKVEEKAIACPDIVGNFSQEVHDEIDRACSNSHSQEFPKLSTAIVKELEEAIEKLQVMKDIQPPLTKYNIEPEHFGKLSPTKQIPLHKVLNDSEVIKIETVLASNLNVPDSKEDPIKVKIKDAFLSDAKENLEPIYSEKIDMEMGENESKKSEEEKFCKENITKDYKEKEEDSAVPRKKEKVDVPVRKKRDYNQQCSSWITVPRRELGARNRDPANRKSVPMAKDKKKSNSEALGGFDVYNIETAMPQIDLEAIECHLRAAREEERRRRTDREEIRRRLAMGSEDEYYTDRPGRKPSLQARLQSGMNLQICFMNESLSDTDSPSSDSECPMTNPKQPKTASPKNANDYNPYREKPVPATRPATLSLGPGQPLLQPPKEPPTEMDFFAKQARLQTEARMALAQAKEMARMQMEIERQRQKKSPITEMIRTSLEKVGIPFPEEKRRLSRQILTEMNVAQLQVIVNDLHTQIETLNESLVKFLMDRDDLHMEQDSMLVDIEDLTRYLGAKEQVLKEQNMAATKVNNNNNATPPSPAPSSPLSALNSTVKPHLHRIANLVKK